MGWLIVCWVADKKAFRTNLDQDFHQEGETGVLTDDRKHLLSVT